MCIEGVRMEEVRGRSGPRSGPRSGLVCPPGFGKPFGTPFGPQSGTPVPPVIGVLADSCSYPCSSVRGSAGPAAGGSALIESVPSRERTPPDLSPREPRGHHAANLSTPPAHAAGVLVLAAMETADADDRHPNGAAFGPFGLRHPADVPLVGQHPSSEEIAAARGRLIQRLVSRSAAASKKAVSSAAKSAKNAHGTLPQPDLDHLDLLASVTAKFSVLLHRVGDALEAAQRSHVYNVLSRTTQPVHLVAFVSVALVAALLFPRHGDSTTPTPHDATPSGPSGPSPSPWTYLAYVVAFAAHFGSQFWMTFVSGLSLFFSLPRHHFAAVQKVLFPLYFAINATLSLVTLSAFVRLQPSASRWDAEVVVQVASMVLCFLLELLVRLYLTPPLLHLITTKTEMEKTVEGVGEEVGRYDLGPLTQCPHYVRIHRAFRKVHATIAVANITAMACTALHAHYLAGKICV